MRQSIDVLPNYEHICHNFSFNGLLKFKHFKINTSNYCLKKILIVLLLIQFLDVQSCKEKKTLVMYSSLKNLTYLVKNLWSTGVTKSKKYLHYCIKFQTNKIFFVSKLSTYWISYFKHCVNLQYPTWKLGYDIFFRCYFLIMKKLLFKYLIIP